MLDVTTQSDRALTATDVLAYTTMVLSGNDIHMFFLILQKNGSGLFMNFNGDVIKMARLFHKVVVKGRVFII
jgi:hypothetical protein